MIFLVAAVFLLPVSPIWPPRRPFLPYGRPNLALAGLLVKICDQAYKQTRSVGNMWLSFELYYISYGAALYSPDCHFTGKTWNQGKVMELENGEKSRNSFKIGERSGICVVLENCPNINCNSLVAFLPTLLILLL